MSERVAVVGGGIVGLANAWREAARGARVTLFERSQRAQGASVRNFGMVWPIGQPPERLETAMLSRSLWDEFARETGVWTNRAGSIHVATREDELRVLEEFAALAPGLGYDCRLVTPQEAVTLCPGVDTPDLLGGLVSHTEMGVDPREVIATAPDWLAARYGVELQYGVTIGEIDAPAVVATDGRRWDFDRVTVASGADFQTLYPEVFAANTLGKCKLQMMRTGPQPGGWTLGPMVASGLTLRHYPTFGLCDGLDALRARIAAETPELDRYGIHVMAAQNGLGEVVLGDSHEYGAEVTPFDSEEITSLMMRELKRLLVLPDWDLAARWHGVYAVRPSDPGVEFVHQPAPGVTIALVVGGCGMTMSFGLAERRAADHSEANPRPVATADRGSIAGAAP